MTPAVVYPPDPLPPILMGGTINLLAGAPGTGKSTFTAWLSRQVADKAELWGRQWGPIPWQGIICADRSWCRSTQLWFTLEGMQAIPAYSLQDDQAFRKARLRQKHQRVSIFEHSLDKLSPVGNGTFPLGSLVYVDPLALFLGGNLLDYDTCAVACSELREICLQRGITVIGTAHASKQKADKKDRYLRLQDRILGSTALFGYTDTQMYLAAPEEVDKPYYVLLCAPHHAQKSLFSFTRHAVTGQFVAGQELDEGTPSGAALTPAAKTPPWLSEALDQGPRTFSQLLVIAKDHGCARMTLYRRLTELKEEGLVKCPKSNLYERVKPS